MILTRYIPWLVVSVKTALSIMTTKYVLKYDQKQFQVFDSKITAPSAVSCAVMCQFAKICTYYSYNSLQKICLIHSNSEGDLTPIQASKWRIYQPSYSKKCPSDWMLFMDYCYLIVYEKTTWENAENECRKEYGSLVNIENKEENFWLQSLITDDAWIGLKDPSTIGSWVWSYDNSKITFENWGPQEPDGDGYCACFCTEICNWNGNWNENYWNDRQCDYPTGYICKKSIVN